MSVFKKLTPEELREILVWMSDVTEFYFTDASPQLVNRLMIELREEGKISEAYLRSKVLKEVLDRTMMGVLSDYPSPDELDDKGYYVPEGYSEVYSRMEKLNKEYREGTLKEEAEKLLSEVNYPIG